MYDAVFVLVEAFNKLLRKKPDQFRMYTMRRMNPISPTTITTTTTTVAAAALNSTANNNANLNRILDCNTSKGWVNAWEHGDKISRYLRKVRPFQIFSSFHVDYYEVIKLILYPIDLN